MQIDRALRRCVLAAAVLVSACSAPDGSGDSYVIGRIDAVEGEAFVLRAGQRTAGAAGIELHASESVETGSNGKMRIALVDDSVLAIGAATRLLLSELRIDDQSRKGRIDVAAGKFWMQVSKWKRPGSSSLEIATPNAVAGVRGTTLWGDTQIDAICALEGSIDVRSRRDSSLEAVSLTAGNCASQLSKGRLEPLAPSAEEVRRYLDEVLIGGAGR